MWMMISLENQQQNTRWKYGHLINMPIFRRNARSSVTPISIEQRPA